MSPKQKYMKSRNTPSDREPANESDLLPVRARNILDNGLNES